MSSASGDKCWRFAGRGDTEGLSKVGPAGVFEALLSGTIKNMVDGDNLSSRKDQFQGLAHLTTPGVFAVFKSLC
jgi:hypothetical protein